MLAKRILSPLAAFSMLALPTGGCLDPDELEDIIDELDEIEIEINQNVDILQADRDFDLPSDLDESDIIIDDGAVIVDDVQEDIVIDDLPASTLIGFENLTGFDGYYEFFVEDDFQGVFVFDGETLLLEYDCLDDLELVGERYFDPGTGLEEEAFDVTDGLFLRGPDYECGDAIIFSFDLDGILADVVLDFF